MKATILTICPEAQIIDLAHDVSSFNLKEGAKLFEAVAWLPAGFHVCVVDPGVGTERRGIAIETGRSDVLIGPDNGVLLPATRFLDGIKRVHILENETYRRHPVSPVFHGRDVFAPAAAHLAAGIDIEKLGPGIPKAKLTKAPYEEADCEDGIITAEALVVHATIGNVFLNVLQEEMHKLATAGNDITLHFHEKELTVPYRRTFGEVRIGQPLIFDDDFGRVEIAVNLGNFAEEYGVNVGDAITLKKS